MVVSAMRKLPRLLAPAALALAIVLGLTVPTGHSADAATFTAGLTSISGTTDDSGNQNGMSGTQVVTGATGGGLSKVSLYIGGVNSAPANHGQVAVYADSGDLPGGTLAASGSQVLAAKAWNDFPLSGVMLAPSTKYWLVFNVDGSRTKYKIATGGRSAWRIPTAFGTWPDPFGSVTTGPNTQRYAINMTWTDVVPPPPPSCTGTAITPGANVQAAIDAAPVNTTFCFAAGTYNVGSLAPKSGDVFDGGNRTAILDGQNTRQQAFVSSTTSGVTIRGFVIKQYASPLQAAAIQSFGTTNWTIENNQITHNAATAVATDTGARVLNNLMDWNGQQGYAAHGQNLLYEGNEIAFNNANLAVDATWEAGGGKAWDTDGATFRNNNVHDNGGNGLWDDTNNIRITYDGNTVDNNWGGGIYHEIGYDATIVNNTVSRNGMPSAPGGGQNLGWLWDAGILLRSSGALTATSPILIANNTVTNNYNGIALLESPEPNSCPNTANGEGRYGPCLLQNILVRDNTVTMSIGGTGVVQDGTGNPFSQNIHFTNNHYHVANPTTHPNDGHAEGWFAWNNAWRTWAEWQGFGNDLTGTFGT
jgi:parallel beta-helix repeat protein